AFVCWLPARPLTSGQMPGPSGRASLTPGAGEITRQPTLSARTPSSSAGDRTHPAAASSASDIAGVSPQALQSKKEAPGIPGVEDTVPLAAATAPASRNMQKSPPLDAATSSTKTAAPANSAPAEIVAIFYRALSNGDGKTAAALVTPEKRGTGPFNEANMSRFYRSLREPLSIQAIRQLDGNIVEARYAYRATMTQCKGTAIVETEVVSQRRLIRRIRANC